MVKQAIRPAIFTWRQTEPELILCAVRWYLRDSLSFRDGEERLRERGLEADHTTIWCWVQHAGPELEERLRRHLKPTQRSWRVAEADVCVRGRWGSLSRALDSAGAPIDCVRSGWRAAAAAHRLVRQALPDPAHPRPRVINTDRARRYGSAIARMQQEGIRQRRGRPRPVQYKGPDSAGKMEIPAYTFWGAEQGAYPQEVESVLRHPTTCGRLRPGLFPLA